MDERFSLPGFAEPMSSFSHLAGTAVFTVLSFFLLRTAWQSRSRFWFSLVFAVSVVLLLTMSFLFHMMAIGSTARTVMRCLDIAAVFVLIAGTFTALHGMLFRGWKRWGIIALMWIIAITGITLRSLFYDSVSQSTGIGIFLLMGWIGAFSAFLVWQDYGNQCLIPVVMGGVLYTVGAVIAAVNWPVIIHGVWGPHETFHLFVLAALGVHWSFVSRAAEDRIPRVQRPKPSVSDVNI